MNTGLPRGLLWLVAALARTPVPPGRRRPPRRNPLARRFALRRSTDAWLLAEAERGCPDAWAELDRRTGPRSPPPGP